MLYVILYKRENAMLYDIHINNIFSFGKIKYRNMTLQRRIILLQVHFFR